MYHFVVSRTAMRADHGLRLYRNHFSSGSGQRPGNRQSHCAGANYNRVYGFHHATRLRYDTPGTRIMLNAAASARFARAAVYSGES